MAISEHDYRSDHASHTQGYLMPTVFGMLERHGQGTRLFELGCGNGANAGLMAGRGYDVTGVDPSATGVSRARERGLDLHEGSSEDDLAARFGTYPLLVSLEVVEHVYSPKLYAERVFDLLDPGGLAVLSTPYHAYLKNLALAVTGKMEDHFSALWEGGHIKFFSRDTLRRLFAEVGMEEVDFARVGRIPPLAKSMICAYRKPA